MTEWIPSHVPPWPEPWDPLAELDWGDPVMSRRLLREHLDQDHDGASRRLAVVEQHLTRLRRLLPPPPARILDAACGPGLYAVRLAAMGYDVTAFDVGEAVLEHGRQLAAEAGVEVDFRRGDLRTLDLPAEFDATLLIYWVLEAFPRQQQNVVLRRLRGTLRPGGTLVAEVRVRPDQPPGRLSGWDIVPFSLLADSPHLLLTDTTWDDNQQLYILREVAVLDDGSVTAQQTTGRMVSLNELEPLLGRAGLRLRNAWDGWSRFHATEATNSLLVVAEPAEPPLSPPVRPRRGPAPRR